MDWLKKINLAPNEEIETTLRRSGWFWRRSIFLAIVLILSAFFLIYPLFQLGQIGIFLFCGLLFLGLFLAWRALILYRATIMIFTTSRLIEIDNPGLFNHSLFSAGVQQIQSVTVQRQGFKNQLFNLGDIYIGLGEGKAVLKLPCLKDPEKIASSLIVWQEKFWQKREEKSTQEAKQLLKKIKNKLGEEKFRELIAD